MRKITLSLLLAGLASTTFASETRDTTINVYGVGAKVAQGQNSSAGAGIMFDSEALKVKLEGTSDFLKSGAVLKVNPFNPNLYFKFGLNYLNQKVYSVVNTSTKVNQYSGSFATGYMLSDSFYTELGGAYTKLNGKVFGDYEIVSEKTSLGYVELAKRWESSIGTIDTTANAGRVNHEFTSDESSYGVGVEYYPMDSAKLSYAYQYEKNNILNVYKAQYSYAFVEYNDDISNGTYKVTAGLAIAFGDITDFSSYRAPTNIKSHLSELNRFENIVLSSNMALASGAGVRKTQAAIDRDAVPIVNTTPTTSTPASTPSTPAISTPTISLANQSVNDNGGAVPTDLPAPSVTGVTSGAVYSIVADPTGGKLTINASTGVATWSGDLLNSATYSITIKITNTDGGTSSITFTLTILDNA